MRRKYFDCIKCGREYSGNVTPGLDIVCGRCSMRMSVHVDFHPDEYASALPEAKKTIRLSLKRLPRSKEVSCEGCGKPFSPKSKWASFCPECHEGKKEVSHNTEKTLS